MSEIQNPDSPNRKQDTSETSQTHPECPKSTSSNLSPNRELALMRPPNLPASVHLIS